MQCLVNSIEFFFRRRFDEMRVDAATDGTEHFRMGIVHALDVLLDIPTGMKVQGPFEVPVDFVLDDDIVDDTAIIDDGIEFRFHQVAAMATDKDPRAARCNRRDQLIAPGRRNNRRPLSAQDSDVSDDDLPADGASFR